MIRSATALMRGAKKRLAGSEALVLLYHRVEKVVHDPQLLSVTPENFEAQMAVLAESYDPVQLGDVMGRSRGSAGGRPVSVTFDDGYADNLTKALPALQSTGVPATVFVTAGSLGTAREFWWDELARILLEASVPPPLLELNIKGQVYRWELALREEEDPGWNVELTPISKRQAAYREIHTLLRNLPTADRNAALLEFRESAKAGTAPPPHAVRLTKEELSRFSRDSLIEIGAHTMTHPVLAAESVANQKAEIVMSRRQLSEVVGGPITAFSYPFGSPADYNVETVRIVKDAGFSSACTTTSGTVGWRTRSLEIPRMLVRNWTGEEFERRLEASFQA